LTSWQIDQVKDLLIWNNVRRHYIAYHVIVPGLTREEDAQIMEWLLLAREEGLDVKNPRDFGRALAPADESAALAWWIDRKWFDGSSFQIEVLEILHVVAGQIHLPAGEQFERQNDRLFITDALRHDAHADLGR
jgi:hypothetical protein